MAPALLALSMAALDPAVTWIGMPVWSGAGGTNVRFVFHTVDVILARTTATYKSRTFVKNSGGSAAAGSMRVPTYVSTAGGKTVSWRSHPFRLGAGEGRLFQTSVTRPLPKLGEGLAERVVKYDVGHVPWTLDQFQLAVKYPRGLVFQVVRLSPGEGWQVGNTGAFWARNGWNPSGTEFKFQFYPGTFESIGR